MQFDDLRIGKSKSAVRRRNSKSVHQRLSDAVPEVEVGGSWAIGLMTHRAIDGKVCSCAVIERSVLVVEFWVGDVSRRRPDTLREESACVPVIELVEGRRACDHSVHLACTDAEDSASHSCVASGTLAPARVAVGLSSERPAALIQNRQRLLVTSGADEIGVVWLVPPVGIA